MKSFVATLLFIALCHVSYSQNNELVWNNNQPLTWNDFLGPVNDTSSYDAEVFTEVKYNYHFNNPLDFQFDIKACLVRNTSWFRKEQRSDLLLKHEQLHFDMAQLFACKLREAFLQFAYTANYEQEIVQVFESVKATYLEAQRRFDADSNHSLNIEKQCAWEQYIKAGLAAYGCQ